MIKTDCLFCKVAEKKIPSKMVYEDDWVFAFEDIKPQAPVHILIIPKQHIDAISNLSHNDADIIGKLVLAAKHIAASKKIADSGYRLVFNCNKDAGQEVFHIHLHLLGGRKFSWPPG